ncbi:MAG: bifunctional acetate--CoA ligase family protein/GNAT family N-acetyltransferase [Lautropia sp.]|nr:bifunctional acetate--CoA ligase family protein/GNAT family N-acetyltransferase [Lautropia sp.]
MKNRLPLSHQQQAIISTPRHRLHQLFRPDSIAVFGVSEEPGALGWRIFENLQQSNFTGKVAAINPALEAVFGQPCHAGVSALPKAPDLAVFAVPCAEVAGHLPALAAAGTRHAIWLLDFAGATPPEVARETAAQARALGINLLGADSLGLGHPAVRLNLLASDAQIKAGGVAVISQSSAICSALLDFAQGNGIGLASVVDTGTESDIDLADLLDYLTFDGNARSIAMFVGGVRNPRRFLGALRAAARTKPVVILRGGRHESYSRIGQPRARLTHTENLASNDRTLLSALERSGAVIVDSFGELFATLEWLNDNKNVQGNRLAIVSNGGGLALLANDACHRHGVEVVQPKDETLAKLTLPVTASSSLYRYSLSSPYTPGNQTVTDRRLPMVNLGVACTPALAAETLRTIAADKEADAVLGIFHSTLACDASSLAGELLAGKAPSPMLLALVGEADARRGAELLNTKGFSVFRTPEDAVRAFSVVAQYQRGQQRLLETPGPSREAVRFDENRIAALLARAREAGDTMLNQLASNEVLAACGIPVPRTHIAADIETAAVLAAEIGYPVVMKLQSRDVVHKSDVGGVWLDIRNEDELRNAARSMRSRLAALDPAPRLDGFLLQPMIPRLHSREVLIGASHDPTFGPIVHFGAGGVTVEMIDDTALALPPLSHALARELIARTRISRLLKGHHDVPAADIEGIVDVLLAVSALLTRFPMVHALDINPLLASPGGVIALDARIRLDPKAPALDSRYSHLAIHPYPVEVERHFLAKPPRPPVPAAVSGTAAPAEVAPEERTPPIPPTMMLMRPIRPDDATRLSTFFDGLTAETRLWRFLHPIRVMSPQMVARFTQVDYDRDMALVAVEADKGPDAPLIGVARYIREPNESRCEYAIVVTDSWQGRGVARVLMEHLIELARANGLDTMIGLVHGNNTKMLNFMRGLGFQVTKDPDEPELRQTTLYIEPLPPSGKAPEEADAQKL